MKAIKTVRTIFCTILFIVILVLAIALAGVRLFGFTPYSVLSGSMEPNFHTGSLIYVEEVSPSTVKMGDPITFVMDEQLNVATHRVVEIDTENRRFYTKGDANEWWDSKPVLFENLIGVPVFTIPYLGYISAFIKEPPGKYLAFTAGIVFLILLFTPNVLRWADKKQA